MDGRKKRKDKVEGKFTAPPAKISFSRRVPDLVTFHGFLDTVTQRSSRINWIGVFRQDLGFWNGFWFFGALLKKRERRSILDSKLWFF